MSSTQHEHLRGTGLNGPHAVRLIAEREVRSRLASKAFRLTTLGLVVLVVGFAVVLKVIGSGDSATHVGVTASAKRLAPSIGRAATAVGEDVRTQQVADAATGRAMVRDGTLDALVLGTGGASQDTSTGTRLRVVVDKHLDDNLRTALGSAARDLGLDRQITRLGGDPRAVHTAVGRSSVDVTSLTPSPTFDPQRLALGAAAGVLIYIALMFTGQLVAQGVVEEKSSRVVELLLSTIRPWQLMAGKVLGIGLVGLSQVAVVGVAGVVAGRLSGALTISLSSTAGAVVWLVVWFVVGFTLYALVFAALGALVSRQEDVGGVVAPAMMFLVVGYVVGISVLPSSPDNAGVSVMSLLPFFSPTLMPIRLAMGAVPLWQTVVSLVLALASIPLLVGVAARIYRNGVVRSGSRIRLTDALRAG